MRSSSYCRGVLGPIEQGEGDYGDELLRSLDVFIEHNGHWEKAAAALFCHRHTLRYRVRRVEQLDGPRLLQRARPHRVLAGVARPGARAVMIFLMKRTRPSAPARPGTTRKRSRRR